ncbi:hypothetical protein T484DRAFT_1805304, partial [Baffinella frigidus]
MGIRETVKEENPTAGFGELSKIIGRRWAEMSSGDKAQFYVREEEDKARYAAEMAEYVLTSKPPAPAPKNPAMTLKAEKKLSTPTKGGAAIKEDPDGDGLSPDRSPPGAGGGSGKRSSQNRSSSGRSRAGRVGAASASTLVDWVMCDACHEWRFFEAGLTSDQMGERWLCADAGRTCSSLTMVEEFMRDWSEHCPACTQ